MKNIYTTTIHIRCPFQPVWDYYKVELSSNAFVQVEQFEEWCDFVRGKELSQETVADQLHRTIREHRRSLIFNLKVIGRHGANCETVCLR